MSDYPWYKRDARAFYEGTRCLSLEARGAYSDILDLMYIHGGPLKDDERWMVHALGVSHRKWRRLRADLIEAGKIQIQDGLIVNERVTLELQRRAKRSKTNRENARRSSDDRPIIGVSKPDLIAEKCEKPNEINESTERIALHARRSKIKEEEKKVTVATSSTSFPAREPPDAPTAAVADLKRLAEVLHEAGGPALNRTRGGIEIMGEPQAWLEAGADLNRDVIPTIKRMVRGRSANSIHSWGYFTDAVAESVAKNGAAKQSVAEALEKRGAPKHNAVFEMFEALNAKH